MIWLRVTGLSGTESGVNPRVSIFHNVLLFFVFLKSTHITEHAWTFCWDSSAVTARQLLRAVTPETFAWFAYRCARLWPGDRA